MDKNFRFIFDNQSGEYRGLTRELPFCENSTHITPHFQDGYKTIFDRDEKFWKLVPIEIFFNQMTCKDQISDAVELKNEFVSDKVYDLNTRLVTSFSVLNEKINDRFLKLSENLDVTEKRFLKCVGENQDIIIEIKDSVFILSLLVEQIILKQEQMYLYQRKSYWTSRIIDCLAQFRVRCRDIFFNFFNS